MPSVQDTGLLNLHQSGRALLHSASILGLQSGKLFNCCAYFQVYRDP